jgi:undecaprenyl-diphosphatase
MIDRNKKPYWNSPARLTATVFAVLFCLAASYAGYTYLIGNFHEITPGVAYRSAQLKRAPLTRYIKQYEIKSVINLLSDHPGEPWYDEETAVCNELGVKHYDVRMSAERKPDDDQVRKLIDIYRNAPRPVLIHCLQGADRSGLAAAMWKVIVDRAPKSKASEQLTIWYGHIPFGNKRAMDDFFEQWDPDVR